ncbi:putative Chloroplast orF [Trypanosoma brucei equiperdum]|uniref:Putative Chloroplast orF n=1 Tax=Trypanosoma brucei equiperdum TaxID=630700 RepID=A0A3L6L6M2_9TRYP|nr:putative Chloroplast orF [Trypanosoma brucei equiperdum]
MLLGCRRFVTRAVGQSFPHVTSLLRGKRLLRLRHGCPRAKPLLSAEGDLHTTPLDRPPPTDMPLAYLQGEILDMEKYRTEEAVWSRNTVREAWNAINHTLHDTTPGVDATKKKEIIEKDLVGLALCTSYAEVKHLLSLLTPSLRSHIVSQPSYKQTEVEEFFLHLGQDIEVRGADWVIQVPPPSVTDLRYTLERVGRFGDDGRGCIGHTPHRVAVWRGRLGEPLGLTIRVGRYVPNVARALVPLARRGSVLILSKAGMGKTTILRDLAASLSRDPAKPRVMVVDTSNEIGGDSPMPLPFLGRCRRIQVPRREEQQEVMKQILQNHSPEYVIVDEVSTTAEAEVTWSISQRGVHLVATCHGESLAGLLQNQSLNLLVGGTAHAFLSNEERRLRNKIKKTILERPHSSPFKFVVELHSRKFAHLYVDVNQAVDCLLDQGDARRSARIGKTIAIDEPLPDEVMGLVIAQEKEGSYAREPSHESWSEGNDDDSCALAGREGWRPNNRPERQRGTRSYGCRKRSNDDLLDELNNFN